MYKVVIEKHAERALSKIPPMFYKLIRKAILALADNPRPKGSKKLQNRLGYRLRIGDYRLIYEIEDKILIVFILDVGHRRDIYN